MAINPTDLLRYVKRKCGGSHRPLPLDDDEILDTIYQESIYTFSNYYPWSWRKHVSARTDVAEGEPGYYIIRSDGLDILGVSKIFRGENNLWTTQFPYLNASDAATLQINADMTSMVTVPDTFKFWPPNRIELFPKYVAPLDFIAEIRTVHPQHLQTIPMGLREQFYRLCELDTKMAIWGDRKSVV